jgi:cysteine desulfurase / selenocysteine lyase
MKPGECILLTGMEHHSNLVPWQLAASRQNLRLAFVPVTSTGLLDLEAFHRLLSSEQPRLVALTHVSNALGTINPIEEIIQAAHHIGAHVLIDAAQSVPHMPVDFQALDADFLVFSGHKMCGPTGIGGLVAKSALLEKMPPFLGGGEMINRVTLHQSTWADLPYKFEAGTPAIAEAIGLGAAADYLTAIGMPSIREHVESLTATAVHRLREIPGLRLIGESSVRGGAVSFVVNGIHPHDIAQCVDQEGVAVRAGHLCCQPLMDHFGIPAVTRASFYLYNTHEEVDALLRALRITLKLFGHG